MKNHRLVCRISPRNVLSFALHCSFRTPRKRLRAQAKLLVTGCICLLSSLARLDLFVRRLCQHQQKPNCRNCQKGRRRRQRLTAHVVRVDRAGQLRKRACVCKELHAITEETPESGDHADLANSEKQEECSRVDCQREADVVSDSLPDLNDTGQFDGLFLGERDKPEAGTGD